MQIDAEEKEDYYVVTINNPPLNIITTEMVDELFDFFGQKKEKPIMLTGAGNNFSAGADIKQLVEMNEAQAEEFSEKGQMLCSAIASQDMTVAVIRGYCLGAGTELAAACRIRLCAPDAQIGSPETKIGIIPGWGGTQRIPHIMGEDAFDFIQNGDTINSDDANKSGLVDAVVFEDRLMEEAIIFAQSQPQHEGKRYNPTRDIKVHPDAVFTWPKSEEEERKLFSRCFEMEETKKKMREFLAL